MEKPLIPHLFVTLPPAIPAISASKRGLGMFAPPVGVLEENNPKQH
jgi:hypothetical protein